MQIFLSASGSVPDIQRRPPLPTRKGPASRADTDSPHHHHSHLSHQPSPTTNMSIEPTNPRATGLSNTVKVSDPALTPAQSPMLNLFDLYDSQGAWQSIHSLGEAIRVVLNDLVDVAGKKYGLFLCSQSLSSCTILTLLHVVSLLSSPRSLDTRFPLPSTSSTKSSSGTQTASDPFVDPSPSNSAHTSTDPAVPSEGLRGTIV